MNAGKYIEKYDFLFNEPDINEGMRYFVISLLKDDYCQDFIKYFLEEQYQKSKGVKYD